MGPVGQERAPETHENIPEYSLGPQIARSPGRASRGLVLTRPQSSETAPRVLSGGERVPSKRLRGEPTGPLLRFDRVHARALPKADAGTRVRFARNGCRVEPSSCGFSGDASSLGVEDGDADRVAGGFADVEHLGSSVA
jgi:hypothetical protein